jgi:glycosyltransferase involved in cell wall biosynthesis
MAEPPPEPAPTVSVLMVAYNAGTFLRPAVESVLAQSWRDLELVLIDNASDDGSTTALAAAVFDPRLRLERMATNLGQAGGWSVGTPLCRGEFIALMDADDIARPERLAAQVEFMRAHEHHSLVVTLADYIDSAGRIDGPAFSLIDEDEIRRYAEFGMPVLFPTMLARRTLVAAVGFRGGASWAADYEFLVRALEISRVGCVARPLYLYRQHDRSMTRSGRTKQSASAAFTQLRSARRRRNSTRDSRDDHDEEKRWLEQPADLVTLHRVFARRAIDEGFPALAVLHARRARHVGLLACALLAGIAREPRRFSFFCGLALWGPVHALGVRTTVHPRLGWRQILTLGRAGAPQGDPL